MALSVVIGGQNSPTLCWYVAYNLYSALVYSVGRERGKDERVLGSRDLFGQVRRRVEQHAHSDGTPDGIVPDGALEVSTELEEVGEGGEGEDLFQDGRGVQVTREEGKDGEGVEDVPR